MTLAVRRANLGDVAVMLDAYLDAWRAGYEGLLQPAVLDLEAQSREQFDWVHAIERSESTVGGGGRSHCRRWWIGRRTGDG